MERKAATTPIPGPTAQSVRELFRLQQRCHDWDHCERQLAALALSYDAHRRQMWLLLTAHAPLTLAILLIAVIGGHVHAAQTVFMVSLPLLIFFALALLAFGVQARRAWIPRAFALALFALSLWSLVVVLYAIFTQVRMREWYDILLLVLQAMDIATTAGYWYTTEIMAGIGGEASAITAELHYSGRLPSPLAHQLGDAASVNARVTQTTALDSFIRLFFRLLSGSPR